MLTTIINSTNESLTTGESLILMVAMREELSEEDWIEQSLGEWIVAKSKKNKIKYILGINVKTRNIVSFAEVEYLGTTGSRSSFKLIDTLFQQKKSGQEKDFHIDEATNWNPQNPIRYITESVS